MKCNNPNCVNTATVQCFVPCAGANSDVIYYCYSCARENGYCTMCGHSKYVKRLNNTCEVCGWSKNQRFIYTTAKA
jgi:hypothetical protein